VSEFNKELAQFLSQITGNIT